MEAIQEMAMFLKQAYDIWSGGACNPIAITNFIKRFIDAYKDKFGVEIASHPVMRLALAQLAFISGIGIGEHGLSTTVMDEIECISKGNFELASSYLAVEE